MYQFFVGIDIGLHSTLQLVSPMAIGHMIGKIVRLLYICLKQGKNAILKYTQKQLGFSL